MKEKERKREERILFIILAVAVFLVIITNFSIISAIDPQGPDGISVVANETKSSVSGALLNVSGGRIATVNLTATIQNTRWKGFVGNVSGTFTLDDSTGSSIYDWSISTITGRVYSTRNATTVSWTNINCSNFSTLHTENIRMNHSNLNDNLTVTFNTTAGATHSSFSVGSVSINANTCPTLNVYRNNVSNDSAWEEIALYDNFNIVYASIIDDNEVGFDGNTYDFQMIVPENGLPTFQSSTAYYIYVELGV